MFAFLFRTFNTVQLKIVFFLLFHAMKHYADGIKSISPGIFDETSWWFDDNDPKSIVIIDLLMELQKRRMTRLFGVHLIQNPRFLRFVVKKIKYMFPMLIWIIVFENPIHLSIITVQNWNYLSFDGKRISFCAFMNWWSLRQRPI